MSSRLGGLHLRGVQPLLGTVTLFLILACAANYPIFLGRIPFPADIVTQFGPWESYSDRTETNTGHAEVGDLVTQVYPWRNFAAVSIRDGSLPLWNTHLLGGTPFLANAQSALFYPINVLYYVLPVPLAWSLVFILRIVVAGALTAAFLRSLNCHPACGIAGGIVFSFSGVVTVWAGYPVGDAMIWLPAVCLVIHELRRRLSTGLVALGAIAFAMPFLAGHPETGVHIAMIGMFWAAMEWRWPVSAEEPHRHNQWIWFPTLFAATGVLSVGIASVQLVPMLEWITHTSQSLLSRWPAQPLETSLAFFSRDLMSNPNSANIPIPEAAAYVGMLTLVLTPFALLSDRRRAALFFGGLAVIAFQIVYGIGPVAAASRYMPIIEGLKNSRLLIAIDFSLAVLAALGMSALAGEISDRLCGFGRVAVTAAATVSGIGVWLLWNQTTAETGMLRHPLASLVFVLIGVLLVLLRLRNRIGGKAFVKAALIVVAAEQLTFAHGYLPFVEPQHIFPSSPVFDFLRSNARPEDRVAAVDQAFGANFEMMYGLSSAGGYDNVLFRYSLFVFDYKNDRYAGVSFQTEKILELQDRRLDLLGVRFLVASTLNGSAQKLQQQTSRFTPVFSNGTTRVFENREVLPRTLLVPAKGIEHEHGLRQLLRLKQPAFDPTQSVLLSSAPNFVQGSRTALKDDAPPEWTEWTRVGPNRFRVKARAAVPSILVVGEMYYPGWQATVNGSTAEVLRVDYTLMGVALDRGDHDVEFIFRPKSTQIGGLFSIMATVSTIGLLFLGRRLNSWMKPQLRAGSATILISVTILIVAALTVLLMGSMGLARPS